MKHCPQCHQSYSDEFNFCQNDGVDLVESEVAAAPAAPVKKPVGSRGFSWGLPAVAGVLIIGSLGWRLGQNQSSVQEELPEPPPVASDVTVTDATESSPPAPEMEKTPLPDAPKPTAWQGERYPQTRNSYLTPGDVAQWDGATLRYALNEMYARHGYDFKTAAIKQHFRQYQWYRPVSGREQSAVENLMSPIETANRKILVQRRAQLR